MTAQERLPDWARDLELTPHPEGGWFRETWRSPLTIPAEVLPQDFPGDRAGGTAILFLLLPGEQSAWHTVRGSELWMHHRGSPVLLELGGDGDRPGVPDGVLVGPRVEERQLPQAVVPAGVWQRARPVGDEPALVSCVVVPGFDFADFRLEPPR
ncbi:cupin domain-containing protein [Gordonia sp. OPL2]|uniref:cupin domain-containing protein n=1 Tax=Gordonia sp. OPL2 TaxID=2486274 RepID=UPI001655672B|nr:cupin domain-containing protein [Gordonia sp. OPL2]RPA12934.1 cupin domain-containing protein [Gordonia sp. OPL2]